MSLMVLGLSHHSAPVEVLERVTVDDDARDKMLDALLQTGQVSEAMIVSTCNRIEIYSVVEAFHPALDAIGGVLGDHAGMGVEELGRQAYVHYGQAAVHHMFSVAAGLDSLVVGEQQILGQVRTAYTEADRQRAVGKVLHGAAQQALHVGKRVHSETGIDAAGASMVSVVLDRVADATGGDWADRHAVVLGAGAMGGLAVADLSRRGVGRMTVLNRTPEAAERLAATAAETGVIAVAGPDTAVFDVLAGADVLISCTGASSPVLTAEEMFDPLAARTGAHDLIVCDLALPRDVDPAVADLPGVQVIDIATLQRDPVGGISTEAAEAAETIIAEELARYLAAQRAAAVTPTVAALRRRADEVLIAELDRLDGRVPHLAEADRTEVARTLRRVVDKLLHSPTVRVKELAAGAAPMDYAAALRELFELSPSAPAAVTEAPGADRPCAPKLSGRMEDR